MTDRQTAAHPNDELLTAYLTTGLNNDERHAIKAHLDVCNRCRGEATRAQHRLNMTSEIPATVPPSVLARVAPPRPLTKRPTEDARPQTVQEVPQRRDSSKRPDATFAERWLAGLRLPVLVPAAVAALAVLVISTHQTWWKSAPQGERSRSVQHRDTMPVTSPEAAVRPQPTRNQPAITTLRRGNRVDVIGEQGEWYRVTLPDGRQGWVERQAFE